MDFLGGTLTIYSNGFSLVKRQHVTIKIGDKFAEITTYSDEEGTIDVPLQEPGVYALNVSLGSHGLADAR